MLKSKKMPLFKKEKFKAVLAIEISEKEGCFYLFKKQEDKKFLLYKKIYFAIEENNFLISSKQIRSFLKNSLLENIIIALEKDLAFSFLMRATYLRDNFKYSINQVELERAILKVERQLYEKFRKSALWQLKTDLNRLEFGSVWVDKIFIDDHLVANPLGFKGKSIGFLIANTLLEAAFSDRLKQSLKKVYIEYKKLVSSNQKIKLTIVEKEIAITQLLSSFSIFRYIFLQSNENETCLAYIDSFFGSSKFYSLNKGFIDLFIEKISEEFSINYNSAKKILKLYKEKKLNSLWQKYIKSLEKTTLKIYGDLVYYLLKKIPQWKMNPTEKLVFYSDENFWFDIAREIRLFLKTKEKFKTKLRVLNFNFEDIKKETGINLDFKDIKIKETKKINLLSYVLLTDIINKGPINKYLERAIRRIK